MSWLRLRDKVIINSDGLMSIEAVASSGMAHYGKYQSVDELKDLTNLCFHMAAGPAHVRYFIPSKYAVAVVEDLYRLLTSTREVIHVDEVLATYGISPADTY